MPTGPILLPAERNIVTSDLPVNRFHDVNWKVWIVRIGSGYGGWPPSS